MSNPFEDLGIKAIGGPRSAVRPPAKHGRTGVETGLEPAKWLLKVEGTGDWVRTSNRWKSCFSSLF